jgi:hypothetical protein
MSHQEEIRASTDELTSAVQSVVETFQPYRADHRPDCTDFERWLIWNDQTSERLGIVALDGPNEHALSLREKKVLLRSRAMDLLRNAAYVARNQVGPASPKRYPNYPHNFSCASPEYFPALSLTPDETV